MTSQEGLRAWRARIGQEKRRAILDAAAAFFIEAGYDATTLEAVAGRAHVSTGTLFKYFPTKAALFGAIMERVWEVGAEHADAPQPAAPEAPFAALRRIGLDYARLLRARGVEGLFRVIVAEANRFPELGRALYERGKKPYLDRLEETLGAEAAGQARIADPALAARQFLGMINDLIFWPRLLVPDLPVTEAEVVRVVEEAALTFLARYGTAAASSSAASSAAAPAAPATTLPPAKRKKGTPST